MERAKHISPQAEQLISEYGFGRVRAEYQENALKGGLVVSGFLVIGFILLISALPTVSGQVIGLALLWSCTGCFFLVGCLGMMVVILSLWKGERRLYIGDYGFLSVQRQVEKAVHWDAVKEIHRRVRFHVNTANHTSTVSSTHSYTILPVESPKASFLLVGNPGPMIEQAVTTHQFPRLREDYEAGKTLPFGWLTLNHEGLTFSPQLQERELAKIKGTWAISGKRFSSWQHLACAWIDESKGTLILSRKGERKHWAIFPLSEVANPALCLALIEYALAPTPHAVEE